MPAGGETFAAGRYTLTWNAAALGLMEGDAGVPTIQDQYHTEEVRSTDGYGRTLIEG